MVGLLVVVVVIHIKGQEIVVMLMEVMDYLEEVEMVDMMEVPNFQVRML
jgi:hypothetical protein